ncbi:MAG: SH3 domain-containing protein [Caldilineaceae bacterium]
MALLLLMLLPTTAFAQQQTGTVNAGVVLNVRSGPGTGNGVIAKLNGGATVTILESDASGAWYHVTSSAFSGDGWVSAAYISGGSGAPAAVPAAAQSASTDGSTVTVRSGRINVRSGPGTNNGVVTGASAGTVLTVKGKNDAGDWLQVSLSGGTEGWVLASLTSAGGTASAAPVASASAPPPSAPRPAGGGSFMLGIQANMWQGDKEGSANAIQDIGFSLTKQQIRWEFAESERGAIQWQEMDGIINVMSSRGINVLFSVVTSPTWARPNKGGTGGPPEDFNLYANFVGQIASRYCGRLLAIEVWNEQNLQREWEGFPLDPASYMDLLRRAYASIKAACPSMLVISGATTPAGDTDVARDDIGYLRGMYQNGLANYSDGVGIHPSGFANPPEVTFNDWTAGRYDAPSHVNHRSFYFRSTLEESRAVMVQFGDTNKRLWATEFGWASSQSPYPGYEYAARVSEAQQAEYTVNAFRMMANSGYVGGAILWNLNYGFGEMSQWQVMGRQAYGRLKELTGR